jgi:putative (di)nucleoside polyphosphate hydrolase
MDDIDRDGFRANVGIVLSNHAGEVFLGGRTRQNGWQFPQGGVGVNETVEEAMYRELQEEVGLQQQDIEVLGSTQGWMRYQLPKKFIRRNAHPVCIGQKQRWFLLRLVGADSRVRLDTTEMPEFNRWRWVDYWRPVKEVIYFKRKVYVQALHELGPILFPDSVPPRPHWWPKEWELQDND